eukprot:scaffold7102_cov34-Attheya_sp.AAC.3
MPRKPLVLTRHHRLVVLSALIEMRPRQLEHYSIMQTSASSIGRMHCFILFLSGMLHLMKVLPLHHMNFGQTAVLI